ncbi:CheY-like chemotaxis protein [Caulobacter segnis]|nr:response regulator [Caulobacter segnis]MDR6623990.1 CheY-like chemotaxis protein [Caulobacter segnis]
MPALASQTVSSAARPDPLRILVVEDELFVAMLVEDLLGDLGYRVVGPAASARAAVRAVEDEVFDFALLDVNLGDGETSFETAEMLRSRGVPFAFVTGYGEQGVRPDLRDVPILSKPIDPRQLARILQVLG